MVKDVSNLKPISLSTFTNRIIIIPAKFLARELNRLRSDRQFKGYGLLKWSPEINHLSDADDTILFVHEIGYSSLK